MNKDQVKTLLDGNVDDIKPQLADKTAAELTKLRAAEIDGKTRATLIEAIDRAIGEHQVAAAQGSRTPPATNEAELQDQVAGDGHRVGAADGEQALIEAAAASGDGTGDGPASGGADEVLRDAGNGEPGGEPAAAPASDEYVSQVPADLSGFNRATLDTMRALELTRAGGDASDADVARIDAAIADLAERGKNAPEVDTGSTKTKHVDTRSVLDALGAGPVFIGFSEGHQPIAGIQPQLVNDDRAWSISGGRAIFQQKLTISRDVEPARITHALLFSKDDDYAIVGTCEIPHGLQVGGGREAEFPAGSLIF